MIAEKVAYAGLSPVWVELDAAISKSSLWHSSSRRVNNLKKTPSVMWSP